MAQQFSVDDDLVALVWRLAKPKPFESLSFSAALRRVLLSELQPEGKDAKLDELEALYTEAMASRTASKKAASPNPAEWVATIPELKARKGLNTWKSICDVFEIDTAGDSARRKLKHWVDANHPTWQPVPEPDNN